MAKNNITQFDATDANNTDIKSIDISEGMAPSNVNNALRALMATLADLNAGTTTLTAPSGVNITATTAIKTPAIQFTDGDAAISIADGGGVTANNFSSSSVNIDGGAIDGITLGTNSAVTQAVIDNININGTTIGHTSDTDLLTLTSGLLTVAGEVSMTTLDIGGTDVTATATELNIMDGVTATTSELNIMDGVTATTTEINLLDGVTSTTTELNITDGSTSVGTTAVAGADGIVTNDSGTMRHTSVDTFDTYLAATSKTLTNKTIDADNNTVSNLEVDNLKSGVLDTDLSSVSSSHDTIPSAKATKDFIETSATASATSASASATSATASATSATAAATSATAAASSASAASTSESNSQTSANSAAASALLAAGAFDSFDDKYLGTMADSDTASSASTTGTFSSGGSQITVASASGIEMGQLITGTNIATGTNVIKIDGTTINISEATTGAGSGTSLTFTGHGVFGAFNSSIDGPGTDNDGNTLATGMLYFNTTDGEMRVYDGANWIAASASGSASFTKYKYVATASQTTFSGTDANSATLSYVIGNIIVALNGVILDATDFTATSGTSVVLGSGAAASDELTIYAFKSFTVADAVQASTGGTFGGNVVFNGTTTGLDLNGTEFILDADGDTSITADTDDQIDFRTGGTDVMAMSTTGVTITNASNDTQLTLKSTDADANISPILDLFRDSSSPADSDSIGQIDFSANDDGGNQSTFFRIRTQAADVSDGSEDGTAYFSSVVSGSMRERIKINSSEISINDDSHDFDFRVESNGNANALIVDAGHSTVGINTAAVSNRTLKIEGEGNLGAILSLNESTRGGLVEFSAGSGTELYIGSELGILGSGNNNELLIHTGVSAVKIDRSGNVGIGTTSPDADLTIPSPSFGSGGTGNGIRFQNTNNDADAIIQSYYSGTSASALLHGQNLYLATNASFTNFDSSKASSYILQNTDGQILFANASSSAPSERMRIDSSGNLLVGTTSDGGVGNTFKNTGQQRMTMSGTSAFQIVQFANGNGQIGTIVLSGSSTAFNTSSDYRLKENVVTDWDATTKLKQLKPSRFNFKTDKDTTVHGFLAHEVSDIVPEAINGEKDAVDADGNPEYQGIDQSKLVPLLVKTIQELEARISTLEAK
jgi:hypothetical protein